MSYCILIPAYKPAAALVQVVRDLRDGNGDVPIVVVDDGSGAAFQSVFDEVGQISNVHVIQHATNLGKGAALKTGLNYAYCKFRDAVGFVTADADGQHLATDIRAVAAALGAEPERLVMGARQFDGDVPLRSRFGNKLTQHLFKLLVGYGLTDTQTGLRGIPRKMVPRLLRIPANGYDFELDMLIAAKYERIAVTEQPISTVYLDDNQSSHFNPLLDSMKIYFVLFRFALVSVMTALIDAAVFFLALYLGAYIWVAQLCARLVAMCFNYLGVKTRVFRSREAHSAELPRYVLLVVVLGVLAYAMIALMHRTFGWSMLLSKVIAETIIFLANFAIQREFIFSRGPGERSTATDWDAYYNKPVPTAKFSRKFTQGVLLDVMRRYVHPDRPNPLIVELGGANSCFFDAIRQEIRPSQYHVVDNNQVGLDRFRHRVGQDQSVQMYNRDVLAMDMEMEADLVFSVGLIEHFDPENTRRAIESHFRLVRDGGVVLITFPTPTFLYRLTRGAAELLGVWRFPDERPLKRNEVAATVERHGEILHETIVWPIFLTQGVIVVRRRGEPAPVPAPAHASTATAEHGAETAAAPAVATRGA